MQRETDEFVDKVGVGLDDVAVAGGVVFVVVVVYSGVFIVVAAIPKPNGLPVFVYGAIGSALLIIFGIICACGNKS